MTKDKNQDDSHLTNRVPQSKMVKTDIGGNVTNSAVYTAGGDINIFLSEKEKTKSLKPSSSIPKSLIEQIAEGRVVLFLGVGALIGADHPDSKTLVTTSELAGKIANKFLGPEFHDRLPAQITELAISETDSFTVQEFIASIYQDYYPADFHKLIPRFVWHAIATTNFDLIIERAYAAVANRLQQPVVFKKNGERIEAKLKSPGSVVYLKLHGCITDINDPVSNYTRQYTTRLQQECTSRLHQGYTTRLQQQYPMSSGRHTL